ncbi:hypothetical protein E1B28_011316 [Marasmius oreades]|uniref:Auxin efflux carrier n=1 Tax=Marasmius oreades TaxID=181124 RepID=A0A9P7RU00_9AGAR|nr:uncharacterized protein E1B28_011316 [Marasmius oreades]KAG7089655.1 hypothetical protein E1B28_011316 [Marasmius oreades]
MTSAGTLIWISVRPLLRLILCSACGFVITKADLFPTVAAQSLGQIILNITLPSLMFSKMVPAFTSDNISALGPLVLVASIYSIIGIVMAWITKQFFWVPHRFRYGILVAGGWGNVGDIPTSAIMSITGSAPFDGTHDQTLAVAYISVFILVYMMSLFPMGGHLWVAKDFVGPDVEAAEVREAMRLKRRAMFFGLCRPSVRQDKQKDPEVQVPCQEPEPKPVDSEETGFINGHGPRARHFRHVSFHEDAATATPAPTDGVTSQAPTEKLTSPTPTVTAPLDNQECKNREPSTPLSPGISDSIFQRNPRLRKIFFSIRTVAKSMLTPASLAILIAFPIALIPPIKGLFVLTPGANIPNAPDNQPPLAFILDFTQFMGAASVPLGLIGLGSALARLHVPRAQWRTLPLGAIFSLAIGKMLISPVLGVLITQGLVSVGLIDRNDKVLRFVCMFFSCLPTATTQVFLTQVYSGTGSAESLSPFLIPQYILMLFSMSGLTAYALQSIM